MAEGGTIEKFPDSWHPQYLWAIVVEYLLDNHPVDILIKKLVYVMILRFEEERNGITGHSMPPARRQGGVNSQ